jgi:catechol 2,3-dioxygenase-like lactoylglutathione lyase family enzyme
MLRVTSLDHLVLTVADITQTVRFYVDVLGMEVQEFHPADGSKRTALKFGNQKINLHPAASPFDPKAQTPTAGSADLCFLVTGDLGGWAQHLKTQSVPIESGPIARTGATGPIMSLYVRDPDANLIEISVRA